MSSNCEEFLLALGYVLDEQSRQTCSGVIFDLKNEIKVSLLKEKVVSLWHLRTFLYILQSEKDFIVVEISCTCEETNFGEALNEVKEVSKLLTHLVRFKWQISSRSVEGASIRLPLLLVVVCMQCSILSYASTVYFLLYSRSTILYGNVRCQIYHVLCNIHQIDVSRWTLLLGEYILLQLS